MASDVLGPVPFRDSFGTSAMRAVFGNHELVRKYVEVEVALAKAQARCGVVPEAAAQKIAEKCNADTLDFDLLRHETEVVGYPILSLVHQISRRASESGGYVHWGATTQDIMDTVVALQTRDAFALIESDMDKLRATLVDLSRRYRDTLMAGRAHLQQALPMTFDYKTAVWLNTSERHAERLTQAHPRVLIGEFAGAAGMLALLGDKDLVVQKAMMEEFGLNAPASTWHAARDGFAEAVNLLTVIAGSLGKTAYDVTLLAANRFSGLHEPFVKGRGANSTMPRRRNPISSGLVLACTKGVRQQVGLILGTMVQDLERAAEPWYAEWVAIPGSFVLSAGALHQTNFMLAGLVVDEEAIKHNLDIANGLIVAEAVTMKLAPCIGRRDTRDVVYDTCRIVNEQGGRSADILNAIPSVSERLDPQLTEKLTDPADCLGMAPTVVDQILAEYISRKRMLSG